MLKLAMGKVIANGHSAHVFCGMTCMQCLQLALYINRVSWTLHIGVIARLILGTFFWILLVGPIHTLSTQVVHFNKHPWLLVPHLDTQSYGVQKVPWGTWGTVFYILIMFLEKLFFIIVTVD